jgi:hypothetical protein
MAGPFALRKVSHSLIALRILDFLSTDMSGLFGIG